MELVFSDNIVAEMTPPGRSAVSGIRISGPNSKNIIEAVLGLKIDKPRHSYYAKHEIDELVVVYYRAPNSYTGQDTCEIFCHGNPSVVHSIIEKILTVKGFNTRLATQGEFTKRAYLNGKMDLMQAEAVIDLINSSTKKAAELRNKTLKGILSEKVNSIKDRLLELAVKAELEIDFEEDKAGIFEHQKSADIINNITKEIDELLNSFKTIERLSGDIKVLITGKANVGKSSLFNKILEYERSIVHHLPGTTRDYIEAEIVLGDFEVTFIDTAGLRDDYDSDIEKKGAQKIKDLITEAFLIVEVYSDDNYTDNKDKTLIVRNKVDVLVPSKKTKSVVFTSAHSGEGIRELKKEIENRIKDHIKTTDERDSVFLFNKRQLALLHTLKQRLSELYASVIRNENIDMISFMLRDNIKIIDELTGKEHVSEEVLNELFSRFCIGK